MNVLLLEDDPIAAGHIRQGLEGLGHVVTWRDDGLVVAEMDFAPFDVAIIDRMVPRLDGLSVVRSIRQAGGTTPVLMLTAIGGVEDRVEGLDGGADDYLVKPFAFTELVARINALGRRQHPTADPMVLCVQDIEINLLKHSVTRGGRTVHLQPREFRLLEQLLRNADRVLTKTMLLEAVWDFDFDPRTNVVETQLSRLRTKLNDGFDRDAIQTVRGAGYMIRSAPTA